MRIAIPERVFTFSQEKQDTITAAVELYKHFLYNSNPNKYVSFKESATGDYEAKNEKFNKLFKKQTVLSAYLPESALNDKNIFGKNAVREATFALISEALDVIIPQVVLDGFSPIARTKLIGMGNTHHWKVPNNTIFNVNKIARGLRKTEPQRRYNGDSIAIPEPRMITIEENFEEILMGKVDWGNLINMIALSFEKQITLEIYTAISATFSGLDTNLKETGFSQVGFTELADRVQALNNDAAVTVMGTKTALGNIMPQNDHLKQAIGDEYNKFGYIKNWMGVDIMEVPQAITVGTTNFAIANDELYFFSFGVDKPVKICMEDAGMSFENTDPSATADGSYFYSIRKAWDLQVVTSAKYGMMKIN